MSDWQRIPEGMKQTCDRTKEGGFSRNQADTERCGQDAAWTSEQSCNCGAIHNTRYVCHECRVFIVDEKLRAVENRFQQAIKAYRQLRPDLHDDREAEFTIMGWTIYPRPEPDALWYQLNSRTESASGN